MNHPPIPITISAAALILLLSSFSFVVNSDNDFYPEERTALLQIRDSVPSTANLHTLWTGPPCRGNWSRWPGIACQNGHVVHLVLQGINLTGNLPADFLRNITFLTKLSLVNNSVSGQLPNLTGLVRMEQVLLSSNRFTGSIPQDYASLPNLQFLELEHNSLEGRIPGFNQPGLTRFNVSYNRLEGPIPQTETLESFPQSSFDHNSDELCGPPLAPCPVFPPPQPPRPSPPAGERKRRSTMWLIVVIALGAAFLALGVSYIEWSEGRKVYSRSGTDPEGTVELDFFVKEIPVFDLEDLLRASAEVLGKGKNGSTYKATLESGSIFAVKRLRKVNVLPQKEFVQQMQLLGNLKHHNLAPVISFYYSPDQKLIIYEAPHGNLKSSNVLVHREGLNYYCKLTDYGLLPLLQSQKVSERLAVGRSPEYGQGKRLTHKADVYCFGIVLLEAITGKIPDDGPPQRDKEGTSVEDLSGWVRSAVNSDWSTDILDLEIMQSREGHGEMFQLTDLALECTCVLPEKRPKMAEVVRRIEEIEQRRR
ncbi:Probable inactive receptor kinase At3g02880 [Linum perenne]